MSINTDRHPAGIPAGGQFAPTAHAEPAVTLPSDPPRKNQIWHDAVDALTAAGRTGQSARAAVATMLTVDLNRQYLNATRDHLDSGRGTKAALFTIVCSSIKDLPSKMMAAKEDPEGLLAAVTEARGTLRRTGSMLDAFHPTGRQPVFKIADDIMSELGEFLATDTPEGSS